MELQLQELDYWAIGVYILLMAGIGLSFGWFIKDVGAYFKGNGTIPWVMATVTNFMGLFSTFVFVAYAGIAYEYGLVSVTVFWSTVPACIIGACGLADVGGGLVASLPSNIWNSVIVSLFVK